jgi:hypothetical protein
MVSQQARVRFCPQTISVCSIARSKVQLSDVAESDAFDEALVASLNQHGQLGVELPAGRLGRVDHAEVQRCQTPCAARGEVVRASRDAWYSGPCPWKPRG